MDRRGEPGARRGSARGGGLRDRSCAWARRATAAALGCRRTPQTQPIGSRRLGELHLRRAARHVVRTTPAGSCVAPAGVRQPAPLPGPRRAPPVAPEPPFASPCAGGISSLRPGTIYHAADPDRLRLCAGGGSARADVSPSPPSGSATRTRCSGTFADPGTLAAEPSRPGVLRLQHRQ